MRNESPRFGRRQAILAATAAMALPTLAAPTTAMAQQSVEELFGAVVKLKTFVPPEARSARTLGRERNGTAIVIDQGGLVLTANYLVTDAVGGEITFGNGKTVPAQVVAVEPDSGIALLRAIDPPAVKPITFGKSGDLKERDKALILRYGGSQAAAPAFIASRRAFAGGWEYLLEDAIFTTPRNEDWSGAALINSEGKLVGVGSLLVEDASGKGGTDPGNMFVPIDRFKPILGDLIAEGRLAEPRPWLGFTTQEAHNRLIVIRVTPGGPAELAGMTGGEIIVGVGGEKTPNLVEFYRKIFALGAAGTEIPVDISQGLRTRTIKIRSADRMNFFVKRSTL